MPEIQKKILSMINNHFPEPESKQIMAFFEHFYQSLVPSVSPSDYISYITDNYENIYGAVIDYWRFAREKQASESKVRVFNPQFQQDGWQSPHTIVSILIQDMPFLVDSIRMALNRQGLTVHLIISPIMQVHRDENGLLLEVLPAVSNHSEFNENYEAIFHIEVDKQTDAISLEKISQQVKIVLGEVQSAVEDWQAMLDKMAKILQTLESNPPPIDAGEVKEVCDFLAWAQNNHFTFLGYREYSLLSQNDSVELYRLPATGLGILRNALAENPEISTSFAKLPLPLRKLAFEPQLLLLNKTTARSTIHRPTNMDYIGIKIINNEGVVTGEHRFLGLYTSAAYRQLTLDTPMIRKKIKYVFQQAGFRHRSHQHQALCYILESYPREELFQIDKETLHQTAMGILQLQERQQPIRLFMRPDIYGRFFSCLVYVARERYNTEIRQRLERVLLKAFGGNKIEFSVRISESQFAQIHFIVSTPTGSCLDCDISEIEKRLIDVTREWDDVLHDALFEHNGEEQGTRLVRRYQGAFPIAYREDFSAHYAVYDIDKIEEVLKSGHLGMNLYRPIEALDNSLRFKLFHIEKHIPLSEILPMLENMGVKVISERAYEVRIQDQPSVWIQDFGLLHSEESLDISEIKEVFQDVFIRVWRGEIENDGFNRLSLRAELTWREILIFRAYWKYLRQTNGRFSQGYVEQALFNNAPIVEKLLDLFYARCNPAQDRSLNKIQALVAEIIHSLDTVDSLDEDRILRRFLGVISATLRSNYFQESGSKTYLSFKFDPSKVPDLPEPRPKFEIFVYSPQVEGVHLRGGKVARGGLRWSDRLQDFRTEILGLLKAQMVKNAVIVPVGSKGGFVVKRLPNQGGREAIQAEAIAGYKTFIRGLLDLTDNIVDGKIVPPKDVVRHDDDDPYLVVAADKGTASFSDIANQVAKEYNFWLGDAFASGGSTGYDHKAMGITARGAWESVKQHFAGLGMDIQRQDFTAVGVGDMSGDVFGNGMLLSQHIKLVAAFNHLHIFLDPNPIPQHSFKERQRLFYLPRSTWADYNPKLISKGGGVFSRRSKSITLSAEVQSRLAIKAQRLTPNELIQAILRAPVDLFWNGGIGTYVKAETEHNAQVGDKTNDSLRINAKELRCKVVAEGGNLGFTQLGRIEYALNGGRINTDALDNSGGVDCSDHEVNIKILLNAIVTNGDLTQKQRNLLLIDMTAAVSELVLKNNKLQSQVINMTSSISPQLLDLHARFIRHLEKQHKLDRELEFLPNSKMLAERRAAQQGLTSPELCILLAYSKIDLYQNLLESTLPEEPYFRNILSSYFPSPIPQRFAIEILKHRLHREIIATQLTNLVINRSGIAFIYMLEEEIGETAPNIVRAFMIVCELFDLESLWLDVEALENQITATMQLSLMREIRQHIERASRWLLRHHRMPLDIPKTIAALQSGVQILGEKMLNLIGQAERENLEQAAQTLIDAGVPASLAKRIAGLETWLSALDIVEIANATGVKLEMVATVHFMLGRELKLYWLRQKIGELPRDNRWTALSRSALRDELYRTHRELTTVVLQIGEQQWLENNATRLKRCQEVLAEIYTVEKPYLAMLSVGLREIRNLL